MFALPITPFTRADYDRIHAAVFRPDYSGYKPEVKELPNGDDKIDADKRYAHVVKKYLRTDEERAILLPYLEQAHAMAEIAGRLLALPPEYMPDIERGALRILEYPPGSVSNLHTDFDLFTLMLFRDTPETFKTYDQDRGGATPIEAIRVLNPQAHLGEIGTEIGLGPCTPHEVIASTEPQHSMVYFAIPPWESRLPSGLTVVEWLNERMARSRTEFEKYKPST